MELRRNEERTEDYPPVVSRTRSSDIEQSRDRLARSSRVANAHLFAYSRYIYIHRDLHVAFSFLPASDLPWNDESSLAAARIEPTIYLAARDAN